MKNTKKDDKQLLKLFQKRISMYVCSFERIDRWRFLLYATNGDKCICNTKMKHSVWFTGDFKSVFNVFVLNCVNGLKCLCAKRSLRCSEWFTGDFKLKTNGNIEYSDKPRRRVFLAE